MKISKSKKTALSRRQFLGSCGKMTTISVLSTFLQLKMTNSLLAAIPSGSLTDYKALVCVFLHGGNDSFNMLTPWKHNEHQKYLATRAHLAIDKPDLLPIYNPLGVEPKYYGVHNGMPEVRTLYNQGRLAFIANVGTLVRPTTLSDYQNGIDLPRALFSHLEQQQSWQSSIPEQVSQSGWVGRMAEIINNSGANTGSVSMNISTAGSNLLQAGVGVNPLSISSNGANTLGIYATAPNVKAAVDKSLLHNYKSVLKNHYNHVRKETIEQNQLFADATQGSSLTTVFPNTSIGKQLKQAALAIASRNTLGAKRQTFFISMGGYDHHDNLLINQAAMLPQLSQALSAFDSAMIELGVHDKVTSYTASDFGRSLTGNGNGTDHGWGGNQMVMGGAVAAKGIYGEYPTDLSLGTATDTGRGRQLPTTSVDQLHGELANWYGIPNNNNMVDILPNIRNFWSANAAPQLGFLS